MNRISCEERRTVYEGAIRKWGVEMQLEVAIEEMSELIKEICKIRRGKADLEALAEEVADVTIMLEQLRMIYVLNEAVCEHMDSKVMRLMDRIFKEEQ